MHMHQSDVISLITCMQILSYVPLCSKMSCNSLEPSSDMSVSNFTSDDAALACDLE